MFMEKNTDRDAMNKLKQSAEEAIGKGTIKQEWKAQQMKSIDGYVAQEVQSKLLDEAWETASEKDDSERLVQMVREAEMAIENGIGIEKFILDQIDRKKDGETD